MFQKLFGRSELLSIDPRTAEAVARTGERPVCHCVAQAGFRARPRTELEFHRDFPDESASAWTKLHELIDQAAADERPVFEPGAHMSWDEWITITRLPTSIGKLVKVKEMHLYGSNLTSVPAEIGAMSSLTTLDLYTSYRLHWLPYEITRCKNMRRTRFSTRALFGNAKERLPFPRLRPYVAGFEPQTCSVCDGPFDRYPVHMPHQVWLSLKIGTDVLPLLVHACSNACVQALPTPPEDYILRPHKGGLGQAQPDRR